MPSPRTLHPQDQLAHYEVTAPLGAGGMGEVYLARDSKLDRSVALKVLPPELVQSPDRLRRFVQEARSASSLNHPNIITIYDIGEAPVARSGDDDEASDTDPVHYISMELVSGKTLGGHIHQQRTDLRTLLGYLAQAAEGIAKAHTAGIVHRDLKPGNIMVTDDGFAKVLDFGLAKLTEAHGADPGASATALHAPAEHTAEGTLLGTVHYMSPEQVQGRTVDHRSDIFSFGCILYEAATRQRPFGGESNVETMHAILHDRPTPPEQIDESTPNELRRLLKRCLQKNPDQRMQSMKDLALELREIADEFDELSNSGTMGSATSGLGAAPARPSRAPWFAVAAIAVLAVAAVGWFATRGGQGGSAPPPTLTANAKFTTLTRHGGVNQAVISSDGRYVAYLASRAGMVELDVHQVATGATVNVVPPTNRPLRNLSFSPDGNYIHYTDRDPDAPRYSRLYRVPSLGGQPEPIAFDVDSPAAFSPDGKSFAFVRYDTEGGNTIQVVRDGGEPQQLLRREGPGRMQQSLAWSPDGQQLALLWAVPPPEASASLLLVDVETGEARTHFERSPAYFQSVAWMPDDSGFALAAFDAESELLAQAFFLDREGTRLQRITNDTNNYFSCSVANDGTVALVRRSERVDLWLAGAKDPGSLQVVVRSPSADSSPQSYGAQDDNLLYERAGRLHLRNLRTGEERVLPTPHENMSRLRFYGGWAWMQCFDLESRQVEIWRVRLDGTGLERVIDNAPFALHIPPTGDKVAWFTDETPTLMLKDMATGEARALPIEASGPDATMFFSHDGTRLVLSVDDDSGEFTQSLYQVFPLDDPGSPTTLGLPRNVLPGSWIPGTESILCMDNNDPARNLWSYPSDGGPGRQLTDVLNAQRTGYRLDSSGNLTVRLRDEQGDSIWAVDPQTRELTRVLDMPGKQIYAWEAVLDGDSYMVAAGEEGADVVLVENFR